MMSKSTVQFSLPFRELLGTYAKDKYLIVKKRFYHHSKTPYSIVLERYYLIAFQNNAAHSLSSIVDQYISIARFSRIIELDENDRNKHTFFILKLGIEINPLEYKKLADRIYENIMKKKINELTITTAVLGIKPIVLPYNTVKKIINHNILTLNDLQIEDESAYKYFGRIKDIDVFTTSKRLGLVNRPIQAIPEVYNSLILGTDLRGEHKVGVNTKKLLVLGSNFNKNLSILGTLWQQITSITTSETNKNSNPIIIINFRENQLPEQFLGISDIKTIPVDQIDTDPLLILNYYPHSFQQITKIMEHILQLLPTQIGVFEGLLSNYVTTCKDALSLGGFLESLSSRLYNIPLSNEIDESGINIATLESSGLPDRAIESLHYKLSYLRSIIQRTPKKYSMNLIAQKSGIIHLLSSPRTSIEEQILAFTLLSENMYHYNPKYTLVVLGLDNFLLTVPNSQKDLLKLTYQRYFNSTMTIVEANDYLKDIEDLLPQSDRDSIYTSAINLPRNPFYTINTSSKNNGPNILTIYAQYQEMMNVVSTNIDVCAVLRHDMPNQFLYFTLEQHLSDNDQSLVQSQLLKNTILELPDSSLAFKILEYVKKQPAFVCIPEYIALMNSEYYYDGLNALENLQQLKYITKPSRIYQHIQLTYEAQKFLEFISTYFKKFDSKDWQDLDKKTFNSLPDLIAGLIVSYQPQNNWDLIFIYLALIKQKITYDQALYHLEQFRTMGNKKVNSISAKSNVKQNNEPNAGEKSVGSENSYKSPELSLTEEQLLSTISKDSLQHTSPLREPIIENGDDDEYHNYQF